MIIQCDHCSAKFRMDDSKLANGPVKVRCAKCKEIFSVSKDESSLEPAPSPQVTADSTQSVDFSGGWPTASSSPAPSTMSGITNNADYDPSATDFSLNFDEPPPPPATATTFAPTTNNEASTFDLSAGEKGVPDQPGGSDISFDMSGGDFDFGDPSTSLSSEPAAAVTPSSASSGTDMFSMDFGEVSFSDPVTAEKPSSFMTGESVNPDMPDLSSIPANASASPSAEPDSDFNFSFNTDAPPQASTGESPLTKEVAVNFGEFDFGEMNQPAESPVTSQAEKQSREFSISSDNTKDSEDITAPFHDHDDIPPSSLSTRKKRGSLFPVTLILGAILLVIMLAGSAVYFISGPKAFSKVGLGFLVDWYGAKGGEEGSISVRNITAEYMLNKDAGELFIVRGEALNNYRKPRASIQIKVTLLDEKGSSLITKAAYCGNSLTKEQLSTLPPAKIEETMNNQFGDSLANMGVKPNQAIPFVVVISGVPKEAKDYSVQVSGSTIATQ